ncbi:MAG TPA: PP0621 family protein [Burkholderiales bacterium]|jgi:hypothetical protein
MGKLLFLLLAIALVFWVRKIIRSKDRRSTPSPSRDAERMVNCTQCGLYLPVSEAVEERGNYYCSEQHRRLASR